MIQESSIVIMRLLLPQLFEKLALHELRALVAERSMLNIHIKGEVIEIPPNYVGILLEGFLAQEEAKSLITPPAVLFRPDIDLSFFGLESCGEIFFLISCNFMSNSHLVPVNTACTSNYINSMLFILIQHIFVMKRRNKLH